MTGSEIRSGLLTLLINTLNDDSFFAERTEIIMRGGCPVPDSAFTSGAKRCVAVAVSDKIVFTFIAA